MCRLTCGSPWQPRWAPRALRETASRNKEVVAQQTTPEQITEAEELAKIWEPVRSNN